jgi:hypothetical protein
MGAKYVLQATSPMRSRGTRKKPRGRGAKEIASGDKKLKRIQAVFEGQDKWELRVAWKRLRATGARIEGGSGAFRARARHDA